jgi:hypothetical protein
MAGFFQQFLGDVAKGFLTNDYLRDYTHASKTFVSNGYGYAPKYKFLFHVYFETNDNVITALQEPTMPSDRNYGLAVKSVQLPKYSFDLHKMNQYNRKRIIQTKINYDPIQIQFHDDNNNLINKLWYAYYTYYYKDALQSDPIGSTSTRLNGDRRKTRDINTRTLYDPSISQDDDWGYIGEPDTGSQSYVKDPFFRSINVYGFNQHNFVLYRLINPMIQSFSHDAYSYNDTNGTMENSMTVDYETVKYYTGAVDGKNPEQVVPKFGEEAHYDKRLSPLAAPGSNSSIMGQGGLIASAGGIMEDIQNGNILGAARGIVNTAKTFKNPQTLINSVKGEALAAGTSWLAGTPNRNNLFNFPTQNATTSSVVNDVNSGIVSGISGASTSVSNYVNTSSTSGSNSPSSNSYVNQMDRASDRVSTATVNNQISVMASNVNIPQSQVNQQINNVSPGTASLTKAQVNQQIKSINNSR